MSSTVLIGLLAVMVGTSFLSGIFGMAGGMILMGILLWMFPVPEAMALHAVAQIASNGWRGLLWIRFVRWRAVAAYAAGCLLALLAWSLVRYVPAKAHALIALGILPFMVQALPKDMTPDPERPADGTLSGTICMTLMLMTGVAGPLLDRFFLGGTLGRKEIVATKAACQILGHSAKLLYFGGLIEQAATLDPLVMGLVVAASMVGTFAARPVLEMLSEQRYRSWTVKLITAIACGYLLQGAWLLANGRV